MMFVSGLLLGIVAGVGIAAWVARRTSGPLAFGGRRRGIPLAIAALALVILAMVLSRRDRDDHTPVAVPTSNSTTSEPPTSSTTSTTKPRAIVTVPDLVGETRATALATLRNLGLHSSIQTIPASSVPPDFVLSQNPATASSVTAGATVSLVISAAP
jgi:PASTA domain